MTDILNNLPIGVFDSGVGGLTVLKALQQTLPNESFIYLGDTARLPYGTKSESTVIRYATQAAHILLEKGIKLLVVACNTASAVALPALQQEFEHIPVIGVVEPGAKAACQTTKSRKIIVLATEGTVKYRAYEKAIEQFCPDATILSQSCSLFVALAEEGWTTGTIARAIAEKYCQPVLTQQPDTDCIVLGCTHFPALKATLTEILDNSINIVDSAQTTADDVAALLAERNLMSTTHQSSTCYLATDSTERFARVSHYLIQNNLQPQDIELVEL